MADNFLEKRYEEVFGRQAKSGKSARPSLDALLLKSAGELPAFDPDYIVHPVQIEAIMAVSGRVGLSASAGALSVSSEGDRIMIATSQELSSSVLVDVGIMAQTMFLKAVEMGLACRLSVENSCDSVPGKETVLAVLIVGKPLAVK